MPPRSDCESQKSSGKTHRNERFDSDQPFDDDPSLSLLGATGALRFLDPTSALYSWSGWKPAQHHPSSDQHSSVTEHASSNEERRQRRDGGEDEHEGHLPARLKNEVLGFVWRSRDNRKGRHALALRLTPDHRKQPYGTLEPTNSLPATLRGICALFTKFPYWDISWCVAIVFTLGSIVWVANGFTGVLPLVGNYSSKKMELANTWTAFAGSLIFFLGSYLLFLEAINANRGGCFGWAVERTIKGGRPSAEVQSGTCGHYHHQHKHHEQVDSDKLSESTSNRGGTREDHAGSDHYHQSTESGWRCSDCEDREPLACYGISDDPPSSPAWLWWPSWRDLRTTFLYQIGFLACAIQLVSGFFFFFSKFTTLPGITEHFPQLVLDVTSSTPQIIGCVGFIIASLLFMLETQPKWHVPAPNVLGWHVGFWKLIGCVGFLLSGVFGSLGQHDMQFAERQASITSFWGSWTVLLGSLVQWYESLEKYPVIQEGTSRYSEWNEEFVKDSGEHQGSSRD